MGIRCHCICSCWYRVFNNGYCYFYLEIFTKKHKHAELIKAWADGAEIQFRAVPGHGEWVDEPRHLIWEEYAEYRIKPEPKPDVVHELSIMLKGNNKFGYGHPDYPSLLLTFDGETGALKSAEVI